jgi:hypothetical protein
MAIIWLEGLCQWKNSNETSWNQSGNLLPCSTVPQPIVPLCAPLFNGFWGYFLGVKQLGCEVNHSPHPVPRVRMSVPVPLLPLCAFMVWRRKIFTLCCMSSCVICVSWFLSQWYIRQNNFVVEFFVVCFTIYFMMLLDVSTL